MRLDPGQIPPGLAANARNKRFLNAVARTRPGVVLLPWSNKAEADYVHQVYAENAIVRFSGRKGFCGHNRNRGHLGQLGGYRRRLMAGLP